MNCNNTLHYVCYSYSDRSVGRCDSVLYQSVKRCMRFLFLNVLHGCELKKGEGLNNILILLYSFELLAHPLRYVASLFFNYGEGEENGDGRVAIIKLNYEWISFLLSNNNSLHCITFVCSLNRSRKRRGQLHYFHHIALFIVLTIMTV